MKKGAMFGLDARIALAIFGALSVISGAALYSAVQQSKVVSAVTTLNELNKAVESYLLDTGQNIPYSTTLSAFLLKIEELANSSVAGWNGPYVSYTVANDAQLASAEYTAHDLLLLKNSDWSFPVALESTEKCTVADVGCYYWVDASVVPNDLANAIDVYVDGSAGRLTGKIRLVYPANDSTATYSHVFMQGPPILK
jgi:Tfp pilus assembly major pilin PilA